MNVTFQRSAPPPLPLPETPPNPLFIVPIQIQSFCNSGPMQFNAAQLSVEQLSVTKWSVRRVVNLSVLQCTIVAPVSVGNAM